jgi:hypothetical protein
MLRPLGVGYPAIVDEDPFAPIDQAAPDAKSRLLVRTRREFRLLRIPLIQRNRSLTISPPPPATTYVREHTLALREADQARPDLALKAISNSSRGTREDGPLGAT